MIARELSLFEEDMPRLPVLPALAMAVAAVLFWVAALVGASWSLWAGVALGVAALALGAWASLRESGVSRELATSEGQDEQDENEWELRA